LHLRRSIKVIPPDYLLIVENRAIDSQILMRLP
jgi:hypothetical protein